MSFSGGLRSNLIYVLVWGWDILPRLKQAYLARVSITYCVQSMYQRMTKVKICFRFERYLGPNHTDPNFTEIVFFFKSLCFQNRLRIHPDETPLNKQNVRNPRYTQKQTSKTKIQNPFFMPFCMRNLMNEDEGKITLRMMACNMSDNRVTSKFMALKINTGAVTNSAQFG